LFGKRGTLAVQFITVSFQQFFTVWWKICTGFVQTLEIPEIKMLRFPGLESPGKRHRSWKSFGILK